MYKIMNNINYLYICIFIMRRTILTFAVILASTCQIAAQNTPGWLRRSAISPDGKTIAFAWQGDIYTVDATGGNARQITTNPAYESDPMWSSDGKSIVFSSLREMSKDIWIVPAQGGTPRQVTTYSGSETPLAVTADGRILFAADIQPDPAYGNFPGTPQLWSVPLEGGRPARVSSIPMPWASVNARGVILYEDYKGYEDPLRKHHTSSVTRDIWSLSEGEYRKLSTYVGENRNPVFAPDGDTFYFLRENVKDVPNAPEACFNVWRSSLSNPSEQVQVTFFTVHPVRYLSVSGEGTLLFSWNGDLYTTREGATPKKVEITLLHDFNERKMTHNTLSLNTRSLAVSPEGKEVAIVSRGEVYVTAVDAKSTRRITNTPSQERGVSFSADGRTLYYASERDGEWGIWKSSLTDKKDKLFSLSYSFKEERVTEKGQTCFQPLVSPDGKWLAFLRGRNELVIKDTRNGDEKVLLNALNYSYSDGDQSFSWSPDSRFLLTNSQEKGGWHNADVALIEIESGKVTNLTRSGYADGTARWAMGGKAMTWESDKAGYRSHGSWGAQEDVYIMFFDGKAYRDFFSSKEDDDIDKLLKDGDKKDRKADKKDSTDTDDKKKRKVEPLKLDLSSIEDRTRRLTPMSGTMGDHFLTEDGSKLYFAMRAEKSTALYCLDIKEGTLKQLQKSFSGQFVTSADGKHVFVLSSLGVSKFDPKAGSTKSVSFSGNFEYRPADERAYIFEHCWKQVEEKFYDPAIHGLDWKAVHDNYKQFLQHIDNNYDFQELLSEMLGELNGSHTGARYRRLTLGAPSTGHVGVLFDDSFEGPGFRIAEVLPGSILAVEDPEIKAGDVIVAIDSRTIEKGECWYDAFAIYSRQRMCISVKKAKGGTVDVYLKPNGSDAANLYTRWVRQREEIVERLSGGRVGYVHVKSMDSDSFREVYSRALGKYRGCEALIVDTRHNGGGWLHDDLVTFLSGKAYVDYKPRGQYIGTDPFNKWTKLSCVLTGEDNYSDACGFPYIYRSLGIGKLIGAPVPGTMTAVWWETQIDPTLVFGIPEVTAWGLDVDRPLENFQIEPDIMVLNDPESLLRGEDRQLEAAVAEMLRQIDEK